MQLRLSLLFFVLLIAASPAYAQRDDSYNLNVAFEKSKKSNPETALAISSGNGIFRDRLVYKTTSKGKLGAIVFTQQSKYFLQPAIIILHGGGWSSGDPMMHENLAIRLAQCGYVCFLPQYRLSGEAKYPAAIEDAKDMIKWVRKNAAKYNINPRQIAIAGHSAGGEVAAFVGVTGSRRFFNGNWTMSKQLDNDRPDAVIDIDGTLSFVHPESGEGDDSKKISAATKWLGESKLANPTLWENASPLKFAGSKNVPPFMFVTSSVARMHAGMNDFLDLVKANNVFTSVKSFPKAPHHFIFFHPWITPTVEAIDEFLSSPFVFPKKPKAKFDVTVDKNGSIKSLTEAIRLAKPKKPFSIFVKSGVYNEKVFIDSSFTNISIVGEDKFRTIITYNDHTGKITANGDTITTRSSWTFKNNSSEFYLANISVQNNAGFNAGQAVAMEANGNKSVFFNCRFIGFQDVLFLNDSIAKQLFYNCFIEGTTDFIFGSSTAWFEQCHIRSLKNSHITAASTPAANPYGFVFNNCFLSADTSLHNVSLGRPWRPYAHTLYMNTYMGAHIRPEGFSVWNKNDNHLTARYAEYQNIGPGADTSRRLPWIKQLPDKIAEKNTMESVLDSE